MPELPAGCEVIAWEGGIYLTLAGGVSGETTRQLTSWHSRVLGRRLIEAADSIDGEDVGPTLGHPKVSQTV